MLFKLLVRIFLDKDLTQIPITEQPQIIEASVDKFVL
jgi:hypothetical protein